jgi:hypothetical protein
VKKYIIVIFICLTTFLNAQENADIGVEENANKKLSGLVFSFSGFNEFRFGMGIFFGTLGTDGGHHPLGNDFGLLFEYNFKDNITYNRFYYHTPKKVIKPKQLFIPHLSLIRLWGSQLRCYS